MKRRDFINTLFGGAITALGIAALMPAKKTRTVYTAGDVTMEMCTRTGVAARWRPLDDKYRSRENRTTKRSPRVGLNHETFR